MWHFRKILALTLTLIMTASMLAGCQGGTAPASAPAASAAPGAGSTAASGTAPTKDTIKLGVYSDFKTFDPYNSGMDLDLVLYSNVFDTLLKYYNGTFENSLCDSYDISSDGKEYTFHLKKDVKFHNGETLTANDVVFSMNRAKESGEMSNYTKSIVKTEAIDPLTAKITLDAPYVPFLNAVAAQVAIMNEKAVKEAGDQVGSKPVGTGPYKFKQWDSGSQVILERFEEYHGTKPQIREASFVVLTNPETALIATQTGEIDLTYTIPSIAVSDIKADSNLKLDLNPTLGSGYIVMNLEAPFIKDVNFRKALACATNRDEIVEFGMDGIAKVSTHLYDERTAGFSGKYNIPEYNVEKAKEYLAKTDYKGETISFKVGYENYKKIGIVYQEQLKKVGINISVELLEANTWVTDMKSGNYAMSTIVQTFGPDVDLWSTVLHSNAIGGYNFSRLNNPAVDGALDKGKSIQDVEQRKTAYAEIERTLCDDVVVVPVYNRLVTCCYNKSLTISRAFDNGFSELCDMNWA